ncbi:MAG: helix-turn-helix domain-containing protein [Anaerolineales bacterium]|nr:helix-turn-helix domain-containing protein [Anaerolineales bacterium]MCB9127352.1 helix-turn-helix domain-containing protein [Ardenticatenales bacterium]MCB9136741.1 helix-turn-helix domain-containing protein [Caldilineaceae bacterium]
MTAFGEYLKLLRERVGLSQETLAEEAGISSAYISQIETGRRNPPTPDVLRRMAPSLNVQYTVLLRQADYLTDMELQALLLRAIRVLYVHDPGRERLETLLGESIDRWMAMDEAQRNGALDSTGTEHVAEIILPALLQEQSDILFANLLSESEEAEGLLDE